MFFLVILPILLFSLFVLIVKNLEEYTYSNGYIPLKFDLWIWTFCLVVAFIPIFNIGALIVCIICLALDDDIRLKRKNRVGRIIDKFITFMDRKY